MFIFTLKDMLGLFVLGIIVAIYIAYVIIIFFKDRKRKNKNEVN